MGQTLASPVVDKDSSFQENNRLCVATSCMQGWRINMEDAHVALLELENDPDTSFFGVFDGHGGDEVAKEASKSLIAFITGRPSYGENNFEQAITEGFLMFDTFIQNAEGFNPVSSGTTSVVILVKKDHIYCGHVGDSRAIASCKGQLRILTRDHKPNNRLEAMRIREAGGTVTSGRVNGNLAMSRALGDFMFKANKYKSDVEQAVIALPETCSIPLDGDLEFILLACDGIWDVMTEFGVLEFVRQRIVKGLPLFQICEELLDNCLAPDMQQTGGYDNMTVMIVAFYPPRPQLPPTPGSSSNISSFSVAYASLIDRCTKLPSTDDPQNSAYVTDVVADDGDADEMMNLVDLAELVSSLQQHGEPMVVSDDDDDDDEDDDDYDDNDNDNDRLIDVSDRLDDVSDRHIDVSDRIVDVSDRRVDDSNNRAIGKQQNRIVDDEGEDHADF